MALRHLVARVGLPALQRASASAPRLSPAAGSRLLSYSSYKGKEPPFPLPDFPKIIRESKYQTDTQRMVFEIVEEKRNREIRLLRQEWDSFEKIARRDMQDLAKFTKRVDKVGQVAEAVAVGLFALTVGGIYLQHNK